MKLPIRLLRTSFSVGLFLALFGISSSIAIAQSGSMETLQPEELVKILQGPKSAQPLILNIGPHMLYAQAHIPGAEYIAPGSNAEGIDLLRTRVKALPHSTFIVLYCGCCPWDRCPNVRPAYKELKTLGFTNVKLLYMADNFGDDWAYKGYPVVKGQ
jgi:thiosulfate/3-mercaptopyruvate sulfurtransferase